MQLKTEQIVIDLIKQYNRILVLPSSPPDGDSLGSAVALYLTLKKLNKEITVVCSDSVPESYNFLPNIKVIGNQIASSNDFIVTLDCKNAKIDTIKSAIENDKVNIIITPRSGKFSESDVTFKKGNMDFDLIITVDCAELSQLSHIYENNVEMFHQVPLINIDHHVSNANFGKINHVDIMASSTTEMLLSLFEQLAENTGVELIDEDVATLLLAGIITDTGSFQNANTTPKSFAKAAKLVSYGARQQEIIKHIYKTKQLSQLKLWGRILSSIQTDPVNRIVWSTVSQQDFKDTGSNENETGDVIDELMTNAPGAEVIVLIKEKEDKTISVSLRTTSSSIDASEMAAHFGGGGHTQAAGFKIKDKALMDVEYEVLKYLRDYQQKKLAQAMEMPKEKLIPKKEKLDDYQRYMKQILEKTEPPKPEEQINKSEQSTKEPLDEPSMVPEIPEKEAEVIYKFED